MTILLGSTLGVEKVPGIAARPKRVAYQFQRRQ